jgi:phosphatidylglycerol lysyltransferase
MVGAAEVIAALRRAPVSIGFAVLVTIIAVADRSVLASRPIRPDLSVPAALDRPVDVVSVLLGVVVARDLVDLLLALAALLLVMPRVERLLGSGRALVALAVTAVTGVAAGVGLQSLGVLTRALWTTPPSGPPAAGVFTPLTGALLAASAFAGPLWRRRIRLLGLSGAVIVLLYSGQPNDLYRLLAAIAGLALGVALARRRPRLSWPRSSHHEARSLLAALVSVAALGPFVAVLAGHGYGLLRPLGALFRDTLPRAGTLSAACRAAHPAAGCVREIALARLNGLGAVLLAPLPLLVLLVAAVAMWHGRRLGALVAIAVNLLLAVLAALYYGVLPTLLDPDELLQGAPRAGPTLQTALAVAVPAAVAAAVLLALRHFDVRPTRPAARGFLVAVGCAAVGSAAAYLVGGMELRTGFLPNVTLIDLLGDLPERYVPVGFLRLRRLDFLPVTTPARVLYDWVGPVFWLTLLVALALCSRSVRTAVAASDTDRVRQLLRQGSRGSLGHMSLWSGNRYWFSADGRHAVAYRDINGVALTVAEPIGPADGAVEAARAFALHCDDIGLTPAFYSVRPEFATALNAGSPWPAVEIAEDTLLDPGTFTMIGKRWQDVRSSVNRADRAGIRAVWTTWNECTVATKSQIVGISEEWVADRRLPELGFTLGGIEELLDPEVGLMLAVGPEERVEAVTSWLPSWRDGEPVGWTLDLMRRRPGGPNGMIEFLIAAVMGAAQQRGLEFVSLSAAPLVLSGDQADTPLARTLEALARILEPAYGFRSLASFKEKFQPRLEPLVLAYPDALALPAIGVAIARAYLPDVSLPELVRLAGALR